MNFKLINLTTAGGLPEALSNMLYEYDTTILTDMIEDAKDINEVYSNLSKSYRKDFSRKPLEIRSTDSYDRIRLQDSFGNISYLKIQK